MFFKTFITALHDRKKGGKYIFYVNIFLKTSVYNITITLPTIN